MTKIMLVEDDNNLREIYEARLTAEGYEIVSAENGEAALAMAAKERPDMIISDVMMPKISGFEMLDILRNTNSLKNVKIIMLTALGQAEDSQRANSLGADRYLVKSQVTLEDIVKATHDLLDDTNTMAKLPDTETAGDEPQQATPPAAQDAAAAPAVVSSEPPIAPETSATPEAADAPPQPAPAEAPAPVEPVAAPVPEAPAAGIPEPSPAPVADEPPAAVSDQATPTEPETPPAPSEPAVTEGVPSVISIPVSDASDDTAAPAASDTSDDGADVTPLNVIEPPATDTPSPAPGAAVTDDTAATDFTSPATFNVVEAPPAEPAASETPEAPAEAPVSDEDATKAQIDSFLGAQGTAPAEEVPAEQPAATEAPQTEPEEPAAQSIEIPALVTESDSLPQSDDSSTIVSVDGPADAVLPPEELDNFSAPVISAPEGTAVPEPQSVAVSEPTDTSGTPSAENDDQLREAAADLADTAAESAVPSDDAVNRMKVISPLPASEAEPTIHQLLAVEEAKNSAQQAAAAQPAPPRPNVDAYAPATEQPPEAPASSSDIDPNSISL